MNSESANDERCALNLPALEKFGERCDFRCRRRRHTLEFKIDEVVPFIDIVLSGM